MTVAWQATTVIGIGLLVGIPLGLALGRVVWHLVTDVTATVRDGTTDADIIRAAFPPGSVTGAPKVQALKVIAALEGTQREAYTGAIGFASPHAGLQLSVAIRTLELSGEQAWMGCGGGIVADSQPYAELEEALSKARPIAAALGARVIAHASRLAPSTSTTTPRPWPRRPDPNRGLLETIAVRDHQLVDATPHLERLVASARHLYGLELDPLAIDPEIALGRIRVSLTPDGEMTVTQHAEIPDPSPLALEPRTLAGGLGRHKWLDRTGEPHHLVVDLGVDVLETATANVWALVDGSLITPPDDGRILPGVTRARVLHTRADAREAPLTLDDLEHADAILLTSSIRLVTPAGLGGSPTARSVELAKSLRNDPAISRKTGSYIRRIPR